MTTLVADTSKEIQPALSAPTLETAVRAAEPRAILVAPWLMQNIVAADLGIPRTRFALHDYAFHVMSRERLVRIARDEAVPLPGDLPDVQHLILLARPETERNAGRSLEQALRHYWRLLFRCRIVQEMRAKLAAAGEPAVQARIERIGRSAFNEAKFVLDRDHSLPAGAGDADTYAEFTAAWLELYLFHPQLLKAFFPSITDTPAVLAALTEDVNAEEALRQTHIAGAGEARIEAADVEPRVTAVENVASAADAPALADRAAAMGNIVRAAILRQRAASPGAARVEAARRDISILVGRLIPALDLDEKDAAHWQRALEHLLPLAIDGWWNQESRLLYDLQKVCVNHEREIYSVGVVEWLLELCRRPLRRPQPNQRIVLMCKSLRSALHRIPRVRVSGEVEKELTHLIHHALEEVETHLRDALRPAIAESIRTDDLAPRSAPERVAQSKLVEELLDGIVHRGFLTLSSVRDGISKNQIKFNDISGPVAFLRGDPLFRIDRRLSDSLDGVYHRGEIYLRLFQRVSSVLFATVTGRFITRTLLMPLIGSYIIIAGLDHTLLALARLVTRVEWLKIEPLANFFKPKEPPTHDEIVFGNTAFALVALLLLGVVNSPAFRRAVGRGTAAFFRGIGYVFYGLPRLLLDRPAVRAIFNSREVRLALRYVFKPLLVALVAWICCLHASPRVRWSVSGAVFVLANLLLNNSAGRALEQEVLHWMRAVWGRVTSDILMNFFSAIVHFFARRLEDFDRMLYAVDEWLRFRAGQPRSSLYLKATLGVFWFYIAYVSRFAANLLVEPQVNPIKHFPVVTVSHKIILPQAKLIKDALISHGVQQGHAALFAGCIVFTIPGIFGFLAWELRSNWMLYRANRPRVLKPVMVGSHGESIARLIRPAFHSGTIPKIFARLRKACRKSDEMNDPAGCKAAALKSHEAIEHSAEAVQHFFERDLLALVNQNAAWRDMPISLAGVELFVTRVTADLACPALGSEPMRIFFEQRGGWVLAGTERAGWSRAVPQPAASFLAAALLGLYKIAGVDVVKEQIESLFAPTPITFDLTRSALLVWPDRSFDKEVVCNLKEEETPAPQRFAPEQLLLTRVGITWNEWVRIWDGPEGKPGVGSNEPLHQPSLPAVCVMPA